MTILEPASVVELAEALRACARAGATARVSGSRHSVPAAYSGAATLVSLDRMREMRVEPGGRVTAAGVRLHELARRMDEHGLAFPNLGGITAQTVGGFLSTGSDGGSTRHTFSTSLVGLTLVTAGGEVMALDRDHPWFEAAGVSMGLLGVIAAATFEAVPRYGVEGTEVSMPFAQARAGFADWATQSDYCRVLWYPAIDQCDVWRARRTEWTPRTAGMVRMSPALQRAVHLANFVGTRARSLLVRPLQRLFVERVDRRFSGPWYDVLPMDEGLDPRYLPHVYSELWVPFERCDEALAAVETYFRKGGLDAMPTLPVEFYCGAASRFWMSPGFGRISLRVNPVHYGRDPRSPETVFGGIWKVLEPFGPRPHWGKYLPETGSAAAVTRASPRFAEFRALRETLDPGGVFLTPYWRRTFG